MANQNTIFIGLQQSAQVLHVWAKTSNQAQRRDRFVVRTRRYFAYDIVLISPTQLCALRELFHGRYSVQETTVLLQHNGNDLQTAADFILTCKFPAITNTPKVTGFILTYNFHTITTLWGAKV